MLGCKQSAQESMSFHQLLDYWALIWQGVGIREVCVYGSSECQHT